MGYGVKRRTNTRDRRRRAQRRRFQRALLWNRREARARRAKLLLLSLGSRRECSGITLTTVSNFVEVLAQSYVQEAAREHVLIKITTPSVPFVIKS